MDTFGVIRFQHIGMTELAWWPIAAPEASRQKGTLQIKVQVQVQKPDRFLTPELSAKVDFLAAEPVATKR